MERLLKARLLELQERWRAFDARTRKLQQVLGWVLPVLAVVAWVVAIHATGRSPGGDGPHVLGTAMRLAQQLRGFDLGTLILCWNSLLGPHPPLAYLPGVVAYTLLGSTTPWAHLFASGLVLMLLWDALRRMGAGPVGAIWLAAAGGIWLQAEIYGVDFVASAAVLQSISHLVASERLSKRLNVIGWGAWMGVAFMSKYTAPLYLVGPCLLAGWWTLRNKQWKHLGFAVLAFGVVALPWYLPHLQRLVLYITSSSDTSNPELTSHQLLNTWDLDRFTWYLGVLLDNFGRVGLAVALPALLWWKRRHDLKIESWSVPMMALVVGYLLLCAQTQRQARYLTPALPLIAAMVGSSRLRWLTAPVGAVGLYGAAAIYGTWTDVPSSRSFQHELSTAGSTWPWPPEPLQPFSLSGEEMGLPGAVERLALAHGDEEGTVGLMVVDTDPGAPSFGLFLYEVNRAGNQWHIATPNMRGGGHDLQSYVGPFAMEDWPDRDFDTALAILPQGQEQRQDWLRRYGLEQQESWDMPHGTGSIWTRVRERPPSTESVPQGLDPVHR